MILPRVIPCLLLRGSGLVKTVQFRDPVYIGDPRNAVKIFNEREVDELVLLDIQATPLEQKIQFELIREIVSEAFMPVAYGGGIRTLEHARQLMRVGIEKLVVCTAAVQRQDFVKELADLIGSQSVVVCIDYRKSMWGRYQVYVSGGRVGTGKEPQDFAAEMERCGAGELLMNCIDRDGTMKGFDLDFIRSVTSRVDIPVIASGGAGSIEHFRQAIHEAGASAAAAGSMFVFQGKHRAVLISYPSQAELKRTLTIP
ncbi:MAG: imidazole glycerol phosphate synthase subunit HisF [Desulfobacteraceae bacterium]|nr:MAG: imidazole glycerol phosphate synthase subunit HisF [Desulfobacteraceae bacterium]